MANTPNIRFKGFHDEWEQRKLGEVVSIGSGMDYKGLGEGDIPVYGTGGYMLSVDKALSYDKDAVGIGRKGTIDKPYILKAPFWTVDTLFYCIPKEDFDLDFVYSVFQNINWKQKDESTGVPSLSKIIISSTAITSPLLEEQMKIGSYFKSLDTLIILHRRKCDEVKQLKKFMLQKMFPKSGALIPEIRFAGFTGDWEQHKLGEITNILSASRVHKEEWKTEGVPFFRSSDVMAAFKGTKNDKVFISQELFEKLSAISGKPQQGDIFITGGGSIGTPYIVPNNEPLYSKDADLIWVKKGEKHDSFYLYSYFVSPIFREYLLSISHTGTIAHYTIEQVKKTPVFFPSLEEQQKIGVYFSNLDHLITLHQHKCDELQGVKKFMLQNMFV